MTCSVNVYLPLMVFAIIALIVEDVFAATKVKMGCSFLAHQKTTEKNSPLILTNSSSGLELIETEDGFIQLKNDQRVVIACPESQNALSERNDKTVISKCVEGKGLQIDNKFVKLEDIQCKKPIRGEIIETNTRCAGGKGKIYKIGYKVDSNMVTLITVCYNEIQGNALYAEHKINGHEIKYASKSNYRPGFSTQSVGTGVKASDVYKQSHQKTLFNKIFRSPRTTEKYINSKSFLARGHLAPDADFLFAPWQYTTYYYVNTAPQWQSINAGNWKSVETLVRKSAERFQRELVIYTGTYDVLSLPDENNKLVELYLNDGKKLAVPKYIWKIVYNEESKRAIVLVSLNNPFADLKDKHLPESVCEKSGWVSKNWSNFSKGVIYCFEYEDFIKFVEYAPTLKVSGILNGIN